MLFNDLREFMACVDGLGELKRIDGAHWDLEIGAITEVLAEQKGPMAVFDRVADYPPGYRITAHPFGTYRRSALALNLPTEIEPIAMLDAWRQRRREFNAVPPRVVESGPIFQNCWEGKEIDLFRFPVPKWHEKDGGRYIGTGDMVITRDPEAGWVNAAPYRMMVHEPDVLSLYIAPGKHGRYHMQKYHARGEPCPVAVSFGQEASMWVSTTYNVPDGVSEYGFAGWLRGEPVEIVESRLTGLPLPATAEIVVEGDILPPDVEMRDEGPFGEWAGYFTGGPGKKALVVKVKRVLFRDDPILFGIPPLKPPLIWDTALPLRAAAVWEQLESSGQEGVTGVWQLVSNSGPLILVVALRQQYAGQVKQVGAAAATCRAGAYGGKWVIVVDDDIDITNAEDVLWAVATRAKVDNLDLLHNVWTSRADEALDPEVKYGGHPVSTRAIIDACKPFPRLKTYTPTNDFSRPYKQEITEKFGL